ncbi:glycosyltransferase family 4 protein [Paenibacillus sp. FJAT-27812]|uniref:glycosyltransferase family 4 protein n=1 Tax=Paenibacillus sp. FJAT-27812 TaxID=1684143 RepID=UPI0006A7BE80|nr:glycosyltransferase family 4 protein [Paenibacillus sp. FJAT-27812]
MRILIACSWSLPHAGGVNTYVNQLAKGLQLAGHHVDIFSSTPDGLGFYIPSRDLFIDKSKLRAFIANQTNRYMNHHLPGIDPWIKQSEIERYCIEAAAMYFGLSEYDIIHAQDIVSAHALSRVKPAHTPLVTTIHGCLAKEWFVKIKQMGLTDQDTNSPLWHYSTIRENLGAIVSDVTISPSQWLKNVLVNEFSVPEHHIVVSHYGFDIDEFQQHMMRDSVSAIAKPDAKKVFMCPARFDVVKGHIHLIHALAKLKEERSDWVCWLVGEGYLRQDLMQTANQLGLADHVIFTGNRDDVPALIRQADFIVLPSMQDNQPFAIIEAQIAGKLVITSDAGGIPEMVTPSVTGLVFHAGDIDQLHFCLRSAMEADSTALSGMAIHAKQWGENHWALPAMASRTLELYELARSKHLGAVDEAVLPPKPQIRITTQKGRRKWGTLRRKRHHAKITQKRQRIKKRRHAKQRS